MMIVTVCPTDLTYEETVFTLQFATRVRNITLGAPQRNSNSKNLEICVKNLKTELKDVKRKRETLEETVVELRREFKRTQERSAGPLEARLKLLEESKRSAEVVVQQQLRQLSEATIRLHEERESKDHICTELDIAQRNLKKALDQVKEQTIESERFSALLKNKERELDSIKSALHKHIGGNKGSPIQYAVTKPGIAYYLCQKSLCLKHINELPLWFPQRVISLPRTLRPNEVDSMTTQTMNISNDSWKNKVFQPL
jgi:myosin heavy subunit